MEKKPIFHGKPLSKILSSTNDEGTYNNSRKSRLDATQTVRDEQGRQRFHGAFTGGFSAGYFNSVDTIEGFHPKSFVTSRSNRNDSSSSSRFSHRPDDYMDEEDFSEFGIAPKKLRYQHAIPSPLKARTASIGVRILNCLSPGHAHQTVPSHDFSKWLGKDDFHGIGYSGLTKPESGLNLKSGTIRNPLAATLSGRKLKISGEAFGEGILNDDDDDDYYDYIDTIGYETLDDHLKNSKSAKKKGTSSDRDTKNLIDQYQRPSSRSYLSDFVLVDRFKSISLNDDLDNVYAPPIIPKSWRRPVRADSAPSDTRLNDYSSGKLDGLDPSNWLGKFTNLQCLEGSRGERSGLLSYRDLKACQEKPRSDTVKPTGTECDRSVVTLSRELVEWRPCSLLTRHFNVPNPFPDNAFFGVKRQPATEPQTSKTESHRVTQITTDRARQELTELKRSIFNVDSRRDHNRSPTVSQRFIKSSSADRDVVVIDDSDDEPILVWQ